MTHVMIDIETLGKKPGCAVLSIGAVAFNPYSVESVIPSFYNTITQESCERLGLVVDPDTVAWWSRQSIESQNALKENNIDLYLVMLCFVQWFKSVGGKQIWCQGANFDEPIVREILERLNIPVPWKFYDVRDTRTVYDVCKFNTNTISREGTYHNALDDALYQVRCVQKALIG